MKWILSVHFVYAQVQLSVIAYGNGMEDDVINYSESAASDLHSSHITVSEELVTPDFIKRVNVKVRRRDVIKTQFLYFILLNILFWCLFTFILVQTTRTV